MIEVRVGVDAAAWEAALERMPAGQRDVYFTPAFHRLHEVNGEGEPLCSLVEDGDALLLVPGIRMPIPLEQRGGIERPLSDVQTVNGYAGPLATTAADEAFRERAWSEWRGAMAARGIVAVFFRLHPLIANAPLLPSWAALRSDRPTVFVDLSAGREAAWRGADKRHRNMVSKARRLGLAVEWPGPDPQAWAGFEGLYAKAMTLLGAPDRLRFGTEFFAALRELPGAELAVVRDEGGLAAASVFLFGPRWAHYQLSARRPGSGNHLASAILDAALDRAAGRGLEGLHLGGGRTTAPDDALLAFKRSLGGTLLAYEVAIAPTDPALFERLNRAWTDEVGHPPVWLTGYRQPKPRSAEMGAP